MRIITTHLRVRSRTLHCTHQILLSFSRSASPASDANPAKRIAAEKEEQGSGRSFRRKAEASPRGLCDDAIPLLVAEG